MSTDATDIRCAECGRDITHATSIYLVSGRYVCDICYVWLTAPRDCTHGHLARSCEICQLEADNAALRARVAELEGAIQAKCLGCDAYWLCRTIDTPPDCPLYPYRGGE